MFLNGSAVADVEVGEADVESKYPEREKAAIRLEQLYRQSLWNSE